MAQVGNVTGVLKDAASNALMYQNWRSPGVQKTGSSVITIMIPYYQILMHLTELLNFRTSGLLQF